MHFRCLLLGFLFCVGSTQTIGAPRRSAPKPQPKFVGKWVLLNDVTGGCKVESNGDGGKTYDICDIDVSTGKPVNAGLIYQHANGVMQWSDSGQIKRITYRAKNDHLILELSQNQSAVYIGTYGGSGGSWTDRQTLEFRRWKPADAAKARAAIAAWKKQQAKAAATEAARIAKEKRDAAATEAAAHEAEEEQATQEAARLNRKVPDAVADSGAYYAVRIAPASAYGNPGYKVVRFNGYKQDSGEFGVTVIEYFANNTYSEVSGRATLVNDTLTLKGDSFSAKAVFDSTKPDRMTGTWGNDKASGQMELFIDSALRNSTFTAGERKTLSDFLKPGAVFAQVESANWGAYAAEDRDFLWNQVGALRVVSFDSASGTLHGEYTCGGTNEQVYRAVGRFENGRFVLRWYDEANAQAPKLGGMVVFNQFNAKRNSIVGFQTDIPDDLRLCHVERLWLELPSWQEDEIKFTPKVSLLRDDPWPDPGSEIRPTL